MAEGTVDPSRVRGRAHHIDLLAELKATGHEASLELNAESGHYTVDAADADMAIYPAPEVLMGVSLVVRGAKNVDGVLIEAVAPAWRWFLDELACDPDAFYRLDPHQTEELVAGAYAADGWHVTLTPRSGDKGRDVIAEREDIGAIRILDQVKRYAPSHAVDAAAVRALFTRDPKASKAYVTTTSTFAPGVYEEFRPEMPSRLDLRDGTKLRQWLARLAAKK